MIKIAVDAMGGDNAPGEIVKGAVEAVNADKRVKVFLVGKEPVIREELTKRHYRLFNWTERCHRERALKIYL